MTPLQVNDMTELRLQQIELLEDIRTLLLQVEDSELPKDQVRMMRLRVDRAIEDLR